MSAPDSVKPLVDRLFQAFGPQHWWPADSLFEVMVGAVLTQNTAWANVEHAIAHLEAENCLDPHAMRGRPAEELERLIRPAGFFRQKAKKLKALLDWFIVRHSCSLASLRSMDQGEVRRELLSLWGIGPETADAILCYALEFPVFVVDAYTVRVLARHGLVRHNAHYDEVQRCAEADLPKETAYLNEAHALFVEVGKRYCLRNNPNCLECPLRELLPEGEPAGQ